MFNSLAFACLFVAAAPQVSDATRDEAGFLRHTIRCEFQAGETVLRVLAPDRPEPGKQYRLLLVLPVEAGEEHKYGDGLAEVRRHDLHNKHQLICASPTFSHLPWYADHPTNSEIRQESYLLQVVLPALKRRYPCRADGKGTLLLGFSKSGWGAWSLLLRHPGLFGRAAAWDSPLVEHEAKRYGMPIVFPSNEEFARYDLTTVLRKQASQLQGPARLGLLGYDNFQAQIQSMHELMQELQIPHEYRSSEKRNHLWESGWVPEAVEFLAAGE